MIRAQNLISILCLFGFSAIAQNDYAVTTKGDTLYGKIVFQQLGKVEQVQVKGEKKRQTISAIQVRMVKVGEKVYLPVQYAEGVQMMEVVKDGYLSLLAFQPQGNMNYDGRLLKLRTGAVLEVPTIGFKKRVSEFLSDDVDLATRIKDGNLDRKDLDSIIVEYNIFIDKNTKASNLQTETEIKQAPKLEVLNTLINSIKGSSLDSKTETLEMLTELKEKISDGKAIPLYLSNALKENLKSEQDWIRKLESVLQN